MALDNFSSFCAAQASQKVEHPNHASTDMSCSKIRGLPMVGFACFALFGFITAFILLLYIRIYICIKSTSKASKWET